jgi:hypothetical protein
MKPRTRKQKTPGVFDKIKNFFRKPATNTKKAVKKQFRSIKNQSYKQLKKIKP